ncbi:hypothetical protein ACHAPU_011459 [Fusarium lateritium]
MRRMKRLAVSDIHILPSVCRKGDDMVSVISQTAFQAALVRVGAGRPTGKVQQPETERPVWSSESFNQTASKKNLGYSRFDDSESLYQTEGQKILLETFLDISCQLFCKFGQRSKKEIAPGKAKVLEYVQKLADTGKITWTAISNHAFLDWGLRMSFLGVDLQNKNIEYLKPGTTVIPMTTLELVGTAVANALIKAENTKNRICYIFNIQKTQKDLAELSKQALGEEGWKSKDVDTEDAFNKAIAKLQAGQVDMQVISDIIHFSITTPGYIDRLEKTDNDLLGVKTMSDEEVKELIREIAREKTIA